MSAGIDLVLVFYVVVVGIIIAIGTYKDSDADTEAVTIGLLRLPIVIGGLFVLDKLYKARRIDSTDVER